MNSKLAFIPLFLIIGCAAVFFQFTETGQEITLDNTERQIQGEKVSYDLNVQHFTIGEDETVIIPENKNSSIPVSFSVNNSKHGLTGITMKNLSYRVSLRTPEKERCKTDWTNLEDRLEPGKSLSGDLGKKRFTSFEECSLNRTNSNLTISLQIKYSYHSQAILYASVADIAENKTLKHSQTADTIVEPVMNIKQPVTSSSSNLNIEFKSPKSVKYKIKDLELFTGEKISKKCDFSNISAQNWINHQTSPNTGCDITIQQDLDDKDFAISLQTNFTVIKETKKVVTVAQS